MNSQIIILDHDRWRKGAGGSSAGLSGQADSFAYAGLDLNLAQFASSTFATTTFKQAGWTNGQFTNCTFSDSKFKNP